MFIRVRAAAATLLLVALQAVAQTAKPDAAAEAAAAAMERAKRQAAGPMRVILEASKARRKATDPEPAVAADTAAVRPVVSRTPAAPAVSTEVTARSAAVAPSTAAPATASAPAPASAGNSAAALVSGVVTQITLNSQALQNAPATGPVAAIETASATQGVVAPLSSALPMALPALSTAGDRPRLLTRVDPELPQRALEDLGRNLLLAVDLTIRPDGRVSSAAFQGVVPRQTQRLLQAALLQWVFEPLPAERVYRIELLLNADS